GVGWAERVLWGRVEVVERVPGGQGVADVVRGDGGGDLPVEDPGQLGAGQVVGAGYGGQRAQVEPGQGVMLEGVADRHGRRAARAGEKQATRTPGGSWAPRRVATPFAARRRSREAETSALATMYWGRPGPAPMPM